MSDTATLPVIEPKEKVKEPKYRAYNVVLLNDDDHSFEYVIRMLKEGRVIVCTTSLERAELKRDQIHAFGPDPLIPRCQGSMSAVIELVED